MVTEGRPRRCSPCTFVPSPKIARLFTDAVTALFPGTLFLLTFVFLQQRHSLWHSGAMSQGQSFHQNRSKVEKDRRHRWDAWDPKTMELLHEVSEHRISLAFQKQCRCLFWHPSPTSETTLSRDFRLPQVKMMNRIFCPTGKRIKAFFSFFFCKRVCTYPLLLRDVHHYNSSLGIFVAVHTLNQDTAPGLQLQRVRRRHALFCIGAQWS